MKHLLTSGLVLLMGAALILTTGACGGGGTKTTTTDATPSLNALLGDYCFTSWRADANGPVATALWGTVNADGIGTLTPDALYENQAGTVTGPHQPDPAVFTLDDDHALTVKTSGNTLAGRLSGDGSVAVLGETKEGADPGLLVLGRTGAGFSAASLAGTYHLCVFQLSEANTNASWFGGSAKFDGAGNCTGLYMEYNADGDTGAELFPQFGTYAVADDGTMSWAVPFDLGPLEGGLYAGGEIAVLTGASDENDTQSVFVLIKQGANLSEATFQGDYTLVGLITENGSYASITAPVSADGAGLFSVGAGLINQDGVIGPYGPNQNLPFEVTDTGRLTILGGHYKGGVSASGRFAVYGGGSAQDSETALWLLVR